MPSWPTARGASCPPNRPSSAIMDAGKLAYMANQIARNFAAQGEDEAVAATLDHITKFWDPRMKAGILQHGGEDLSPIAARAISVLREGQVPQ